MGRCPSCGASASVSRTFAHKAHVARRRARATNGAMPTRPWRNADTNSPCYPLIRERHRGRHRRRPPAPLAGGCVRRRPGSFGANKDRSTWRRSRSGWGAPLASPSSVMVGTPIAGPSASRFARSRYSGSPSASPSLQR